MKFLADECLHVAVVEALRRAGHEVATIQAGDAGASDRAVLQRALEGRAILLTADKDFGRLVIAQEAATTGVVLFRRAARRPERAAARLLALIDERGDQLHDLYVVVTPERARTRGLGAARAS